MKIRNNGEFVGNEDFKYFIGKTIINVEGLAKDSEEVQIFFSDGSWLRFYHEQDCCEHVYIYDVDGDPKDLINGKLIMLEMSTNRTDTEGIKYHDSLTWTFYKIAAGKASITIRWLGESNGYYSEDVDFIGELK